MDEAKFESAAQELIGAAHMLSEEAANSPQEQQESYLLASDELSRIARILFESANMPYVESYRKKFEKQESNYCILHDLIEEIRNEISWFVEKFEQAEKLIDSTGRIFYLSSIYANGYLRALDRLSSTFETPEKVFETYEEFIEYISDKVIDDIRTIVNDLYTIDCSLIRIMSGRQIKKGMHYVYVLLLQELSGAEPRVAKIESLQEKIRNAWTNAKNSQIVGPFGRFDYQEIRYRISKALPT